MDKTDHERPFKPSNPPKKGNHCTISKFPEYRENPPKETVRVRPVEGQEDPPRWRMTTNSYSKPTPSVVTNMKNMKASFPSVFARRTSH